MSLATSMRVITPTINHVMGHSTVPYLAANIALTVRRIVSAGVDLLAKGAVQRQRGVHAEPVWHGCIV